MTGRSILAPNMLWLCVDTCTDTTFSGRLYSIVHPEKLVYKDFVQFVLLADALFDENGFPQAFQKKRSFIEEETTYEEIRVLRHKKKYESNAVMNQKGDLATFVIVVESRAHSEWQGRILSTNFTLIQQFLDILDLSKVILKEIG